jgi:hypothetical protein
MIQIIIAFAPGRKLNIRFRKGNPYWMKWGRPRARSCEHRRRCRSMAAEGGGVVRWSAPRNSTWGAVLGGRTRRRVVVRRSRLAAAEPETRPRRRGNWSGVARGARMMSDSQMALELGFSGVRTANWRLLAS